MDLQKYTQDATRTESRLEAIAVDTYNLVNVMKVFIAAGNLLDMMKKNIFYHKPIDQKTWELSVKDIEDAQWKLGITSQVTTTTEININPRLFHGIVGLATESTELIEALLKGLLHSQPIDEVNIREELGDVNWYQAIIVDSTNSNWDEILNTNIAKLRARYPDKFTSDSAINRDLTTERKILEGEQNVGEES